MCHLLVRISHILYRNVRCCLNAEYSVVGHKRCPCQSTLRSNEFNTHQNRKIPQQNFIFGVFSGQHLLAQTDLGRSFEVSTKGQQTETDYKLQE
jgi:hypothetical protein